jgi:hypothetical protein
METKTLNKLAHLQYPVGSKILVTHPDYKNHIWLYEIASKTDTFIGLKRISVNKNGETVTFKNCSITVDPSWFEMGQKRKIKIVV